MIKIGIMANPWFRFKHFMIRQDRCAMKVGTDSVILGAWTPLEGTSRALDVGTGTGLLALMLAQRKSGLIADAVEIDSEAADQAAGNVSESPFRERIRVQCISFQEFVQKQHQPGPGHSGYDLVICNPPYFSQAFYPPGEQRSVARHDSLLKFPELLAGSAEVLRSGGKLSVILPSEAADAFTRLGNDFGFAPKQVLRVIPGPDKPVKRTCILLGKDSRGKTEPAIETSLVIETGQRHVYSAEYLELTREFYL